MTRRQISWLSGFLITALLLLPVTLTAQERTLQELKDEMLARAQKNAYPVGGLRVEDVREVLSRLVSMDPDHWAREWSRAAEPYEQKADELARAGRTAEAQAAYYQAYKYYYFARWPLPNSPGKKEAYKATLRTYLAAARYLDAPVERVTIPFEGKQIVGYLRLPKGASKPPVVFHWGGIDGWKEDRREAEDQYLAAGWASFVIDIPGTGESPILATVDADRLFSRVIDYLQTRPEIDGKRLAVQGSSWGGYWAARLAHTERSRIRAAVNWGGPIHYYFQPEWQRKALETREYLFGLFDARAALYGVTTREAFLDEGSKRSLKALGILGQPSAPLLSINGKNDSQVPIADLYILSEAGSPKSFWVNPNGGHMGRGPGGNPEQVFKQVVIPWLAVHLEGK